MLSEPGSEARRIQAGELARLGPAAPDDQVPALRDAELLVPGERVAATARSAGWRGRTTLAAGAEDDAMFAALLDRWGRGGPRDAA